MRIVDLFSGLEGWGGPHRERHVVCSVEIDPRFEPDVVADVLDPDVGARIVERLGGPPDVLLASPPCEGFSVLNIGKNWTRPTDVPANAPKTDAARLAVRLVERTRELIDELRPAFFVIENPRAKLRRLPVVADLERRTVTYCKLGEPFMKPTDLWGGFPPSLVLPEACRSRGGKVVEVDGIWWQTGHDGEPCHVSAPRGSRTSTQGEFTLFDRARIAKRGWDRADRNGVARLDPRAHPDALVKALKEPGSAPLAAVRAKIPERLSRLVVDAAERDLELQLSPSAPTLF